MSTINVFFLHIQGVGPYHSLSETAVEINVVDGKYFQRTKIQDMPVVEGYH